MKSRTGLNNHGHNTNTHHETRMLPLASSSSSIPKLGHKRGRGGGGGHTVSVFVCIVLCAISSLGSLYGGIFLGWNLQQGEIPTTAAVSHRELQLQTQITQLQAELKGVKAQALLPPHSPNQKLGWSSTSTANDDEEENDDDASSRNGSPRSVAFDPDRTGRYLSGVKFVNRMDFATKFDMGVPLDDNTDGNDQVTILYSTPRTFPNEEEDDASTTDSSSLSDVERATENCDVLNIVLTQPSQERQCLAVMGQYESYHVQKFMRLPDSHDEHGGYTRTGNLDPALPLRYVSRGMQTNGRISAKIPLIAQTQQHWDNLLPYLTSLDSVLHELQPLLVQVASHNSHNTVIVMVCNFGQSELFLNYVCNTHAKGMGELLRNVILFATDEEMYDLGISMGITTYYSQTIFGSVPKEFAKAYANSTFKKIMAAKVYCVHLCSQLGYNILFQDVDVIWYKDPLGFFHNTTSPQYHFDMYYQDDGNHALFYAPYSANTGFYFIRNNVRTQYFFNALLMNGDLIISTSSHQIALVALLNEHASMYGLKVKTWERNLEEFPGGYSYHRKREFMKQLIRGLETGTKEVDPYIFHMSWTKNKNDKVKFFQQLGEWYLTDKCTAKSKTEIDTTFGNGGDETQTGIDRCCAAAPFVTCHYRDKPSKIPCKDSPPIDKNARSFW